MQYGRDLPAATPSVFRDKYFCNRRSHLYDCSALDQEQDFLLLLVFLLFSEQPAASPCQPTSAMPLDEACLEATVLLEGGLPSLPALKGVLQADTMIAIEFLGGKGSILPQRYD